MQATNTAVASKAFIISLLVRNQLTSSMRDKELSDWTCQGLSQAGLFVATVDDVVLGSVAYTINKEVHFSTLGRLE